MLPLKLNLDCKVDKRDYLVIMQGYTYKLEIDLFDNGELLDLTGITVNVDFTKADKKFIIKTSGITKEGNKIKFDSDSDFTNKSGNGKMQVILKKDGYIFGSWVIDVVIKPSAINDNDGQSENKLTITQDLKDTIAKAESDIVAIPIEAEKKINELTSQANTSIETLKTNTQKTITDLTNQANTSINNVSSNADTKINTLITKSNQTIANLEQAIANGDIEALSHEVFDKEYSTFTTNKSIANVGESEISGLMTLEEPMLEETTEDESGIMTLEEPMIHANTVTEKVKTGIPKNATLKGKTLVNLVPKFNDSRWQKNGSGGTNIIKTNDYIEINVTSTGSAVIDFKDMTLFESNTDYTFIINILESTFPSVSLSSFNSTNKSLTIGYNKFKINLNNLTDSFIRIGYTGTVEANSKLKISNIIVLEGDYTNDDIPYFEGMASVVNPNVTSVGKNLIPSLESGILTWVTGEDYNSENLSTRTSFIPIKKGVTIVSKYRFVPFYYDENKTYIGVGDDLIKNSVDGKTKWTVPNTTQIKYVRFVFRIVFNPSISDMNTLTDIMVEESSTPTTYEPYKSNTVTVTTGETLRSVSNEVYDELDLKTGILTRRVLEFTLSSNGWVNSYKSNDNFASNHIAFFNSMAMLDVPVLCDKLPSLTEDEWNNMSKSGIYIGKHDTFGVIVGVVLPKSVLSEDTINAFVQYMTNNPVTFNYGFSATYNTEKNKTTGVPFIYEDGHILLGADSILPTLEYTVATTLKGQGENTAEELLDVKLSKLDKTEKASDSALLNGVKEDTSVTGNTIVKRDSYGGAKFKNLTMNNNNSLYGITTGGGTVNLAYLSNTNKTVYGAITNGMLLRSQSQPLLNVAGTEKEILSQHNLPIESGTFTPNIKTITSGVSFTLNEDTFGRYQRIGNKVFVNMRIAWTTKNNAPAGEGVVIGGLPYAPRYSYETLTIGLYHGLGLPSSALELVTHISSGNGGIVLYYTQSATNWLIYTPQHINNEGSIAISGFYTI